MNEYAFSNRNEIRERVGAVLKDDGWLDIKRSYESKVEQLKAQLLNCEPEELRPIQEKIKILKWAINKPEKIAEGKIGD